MSTVTVTGRDELGRIIDVILTTTNDVAPPGPETVATGGGGAANPAGFVEPTTATPEEIVNALITVGLMSGVPGGSPTPLPTTDPLVDGAFWNNNGVVMVSAG